MRAILGTLTGNRFVGVLTGAGITAVLQSSSVTTVMLVGFVSAGLMSLSQAIGVVLGANIGTTVTAQIIAFKVTKFALVPVAIGFVVYFLAKKERTRQYGYLIMGLGLIFFGMSLMSASMKPLRGYPPFIDWMQSISSPAIAIIVAAAFTALVQSSSATMGVVIAMSMQGLVSLETGIALLLGANIGTCITAGLAAIGKPREAVRVAVAHTAFNVLGALLVVWFIPYFSDLVRLISPAADAGLVGTDRLAAEAPRQIANAHTIFNIGVAVVFLPLAPLLARFCEWVVRDRPIADVEMIRPKYLHDELLATPSLALAAVRAEIGRLGERVKNMLSRVIVAVLRGDDEDLDAVAELDDEVDDLHSHIVEYLGKISQKTLSRDAMEEFFGLLEATNAFENAGDVIETELVGQGRQRLRENVTVSAATQEVIENLHNAVLDALADAVAAVRNNDAELARAVIAHKPKIAELVEAASHHQADRLVADEPNRLATYALETDILEKLRRIYYFAKRAAKVVASKP